MPQITPIRKYIEISLKVAVEEHYKKRVAKATL
jgi:hypothetical protein